MSAHDVQGPRTHGPGASLLPGASPGEGVDVALRDGSSLRVRPVRPEDREAIHHFLSGLSPDSAYFRVCGVMVVDALVDWALDVDGHDRFGIVAVRGASQEVVGHAGYVRLSPQRAEVAFEVADSLQGLGIGTLLLAQLAVVASAEGISEFCAEVMPTNHRMLELVLQSGFTLREESTDGFTELIFDTELSPETLRRFDARERTAARAAVAHLLAPGTVALFGAGWGGTSVGDEVLANLVRGGFRGTLHPVHPRRRNLRGVVTVPDLGHVGAPIDLALIASREEDVLEHARACAAAGVRALIVLTGLGQEADGGEPAPAVRLREICRASGMRLLGPRSLGVLNLDPAVSLNASLIRAGTPRGRIALMSQSGAVGVALAASAARFGIGLSSVVLVGDKADLSGNDLLAYWEQDPQTSAILLYLESFGNPRRFTRVAREVSQHTPILAVKSGRAPLGLDGVVPSRGARLLRGAEVTLDALFAQTGVIRTETASELLHTARLLSAQPAPAGPRVAVLANGQGPARLCLDACRAAGLEPVEPGGRILAADCEAADLATAARELVATGTVDAVITVFVPAGRARTGEVAEAVDRVAAETPGTSFATVLMDRVLPRVSPHAPARAARYLFPEDAAGALGRLAAWSRWRAGAREEESELSGVRPEVARELIARRGLAGEVRLDPADATELFGLYGICCAAAPALSVDAHAAAGEVGAREPCFLGAVCSDALGGILVGARPGRPPQAHLIPLSALEAEAMASELAAPLWADAPPASPAQVHDLADLLLRLAMMVELHPEIAGLELELELELDGFSGRRVGQGQIVLGPRVPAPAPGRLR